ncbi:hypothetical protein [Rudanella lutea]|uniref:hypothetical protein n=1 Tax=Rudanella lutea TaxID=451374 RepID=UPI0003807261|nr:hypothetical protein [Rudanella lutea]
MSQHKPLRAVRLVKPGELPSQHQSGGAEHPPNGKPPRQTDWLLVLMTGFVLLSLLILWWINSPL